MNTPRAETIAAPDAAETESSVRVLHNFVGGRWQRSDSTEFGEVRNPVTDELLAQVPLGAAGDVDRAVQAALKAFTTWRKTPPVSGAERSVSRSPSSLLLG